MGQQIKNNLKKLGEYAETRLTRSILRWNYRKKAKPLPPENQLDNKSRQVVANTHQVIAKRGKNILNELKKVYFNGRRKKEDSGK